MSETRTTYALLPEELLQKQEDAEEEALNEMLINLRAGLLQAANAIGKYTGKEEKACPHCGGRNKR